ncbi:MAG: hypothetical protein BGO12_12295 [Verrucomicrobia bacterium 61-8]|nr:MAG: hypothetical protein BGO12_12295 [Verrucomicrobia bacterium 61-8]
MGAKKQVIADLPSGVGVYGDSKKGWRVRLGSRFTGGLPQRKRFDTLQEAREWIFGQGQKEASKMPVLAMKKEAGESAFALNASQLQEAINAFKRLSAVELGLTEAVSYAISHLRPAGGSITLAEASKKGLEIKKQQGISEKHLKGLTSIFDRISDDLGKEKLSAFSRESLEAWLAEQDDITLATKASYARHVHILFAEALERGWCVINPAQKLTRNSSTDGDIAVWGVKQMAELLEAAKTHEPHLITGLAIKAFAGLRTSELLRLDWAQVGDKKIQVLGKNAKTRRSRGIEIQENLRQWLDYKPVDRTGLVVGLSENGWHDAVQRLCETAKISMPSNVLRHSFGTYHYYKTKSETLTAYELGNSPGVVLAHYRAVAVKDADVTGWFEITP